MSWQNLITVDPSVLVGKPIIKGTRLAVEHILDLVAAGCSEAAILENYPGITAEQIRACVAYAADIVRSERIYPLGA